MVRIGGGAAIVGAGVAAMVAVRFVLKKKNKAWWLRWKLTILSHVSRSSFVLEGVKVPVALLPESSRGDEEGFVECNVHIHSGKIAAVLYKDNDHSIPRYRCDGVICLPCFSDSHAHLVKTQCAPRIRNATKSISGALNCEVEDQPRWTFEDISRRMMFSLECAYHHGTSGLRTHLDGCVAEDEAIREAVYKAFDIARDAYEKRGLTVQGVANLYLPQYLDDDFAQKHCERALSRPGVVLGAYVGNVAETPLADVSKAMDAMFAKAIAFGVDVDLHIDETNDSRCRGLVALCDSLEKARNDGYEGHVVLGHACALSLQSTETKKSVCDRLAAAGKCFVVANPFTNLGLQDRAGSTLPHSVEISPDVPRTPQWRGLTLMQELRAAGVGVAAASDNVRDHWYTFGDYDCLQVWAYTQALAHLDTAPNEGSWADIVTDAAARAMNLPFANSLCSVGAPADLVLFPNAKRASELFARPHTDRIVLRQGKVQHTELPEFSQLDDLVAVKTPPPPPDANVMRGATRQVRSGMM